MSSAFHQENEVPTCDECGKPCPIKFVRAEGKVFHTYHFLCAECNIMLTGQSYWVRDGQFYCEEHFHLTFDAKCSACGKVIKGAGVRIDDKLLHQTCFVCSLCKSPLASSYFECKGEPFVLVVRRGCQRACRICQNCDEKCRGEDGLSLARTVKQQDDAGENEKSDGDQAVEPEHDAEEEKEEGAVEGVVKEDEVQTEEDVDSKEKEETEEAVNEETAKDEEAKEEVEKEEAEEKVEDIEEKVEKGDVPATVEEPVQDGTVESSEERDEPEGGNSASEPEPKPKDQSEQLTLCEPESKEPESKEPAAGPARAPVPLTPICVKCGEHVQVGEAMLSALGGKYHQRCFRCSECDNPFANGEFYQMDQKPYCESCLRKVQAEKCPICGQQVGRESEGAVERHGVHWHEACMNCFLCDKNVMKKVSKKNPDELDTRSRFHEQRLYCEDCYATKFGKEICAACHEWIVDSLVRAMKKPFHTDCFRCARCNISLISQDFYAKDDKPLCKNCMVALEEELRKLPLCSVCKNPVKDDEESHALSGGQYHVKCLSCALCRLRMQPGEKMHEYQQKIYCSGCYGTLNFTYCATCKEPITTSQMVRAMGLHYHPECFTCTRCKRVFRAKENFLEFEKQPYCEECFIFVKAPKCYECLEPITDTIVEALGRKYHEKCLVCSQCKKTIEGKFREYLSKTFCNDCYATHGPKADMKPITSPRPQSHKAASRDNFVKKERPSRGSAAGGALPKLREHNKEEVCHKCHNPVFGMVVHAMDHPWHPHHFVCKECEMMLREDGFKVIGEWPYCLPCYAKRGPQEVSNNCAKCSKSVAGQKYITALSKRWHRECFVCNDCGQDFLGGRKFFGFRGMPYCKACRDTKGRQ